jgi:hypothetical protein
MKNPDGYPGRKLSVAGALSALLSVTFMVLAAYIGWSSTLVTGQEAIELRWFAVLVGAYGIWRMVRIVLRERQERS